MKSDICHILRPRDSDSSDGAIITPPANVGLFHHGCFIVMDWDTKMFGQLWTLNTGLSLSPTLSFISCVLTPSSSSDRSSSWCWMELTTCLLRCISALIESRLKRITGMLLDAFGWEWDSSSKQKVNESGAWIFCWYPVSMTPRTTHQLTHWYTRWFANTKFSRWGHRFNQTRASRSE